MFKTQCPDPFKNKVKCEECKHYVDKYDAQEIKENTRSLYWDGTKTLYYCPMHRKPYQRVRHSSYGTSYYAEVQVEEDGTPLGFAPKKK